MTLVLSVRRVCTALAVVAGLLVIASCIGLVADHGLGHDHLGGLIPLFSVREERSVPTAFSCLLLLLIAVLLALIGAGGRQCPGTGHRWWIALAFVFLFLALDESLSFHEKLNRPLGAARDLSGAFYFAWVIPYSIMVGVLGLLSIRFLRSLPSQTRRRMLLAAALYLGGAVGMEMAGGAVASRTESEKTLLYDSMIVIEESLEMAGMLVMSHALMRHIQSELPGLQVSVRP